MIFPAASYAQARKTLGKNALGLLRMCAVLPVTQLPDMGRRILFLMFVVVQRESHTKKNIVLIGVQSWTIGHCVRKIVRSHIQYIIIKPYLIACLFGASAGQAKAKLVYSKTPRPNTNYHKISIQFHSRIVYWSGCLTPKPKSSGLKPQCGMVLKMHYRSLWIQASGYKPMKKAQLQP